MWGRPSDNHSVFDLGTADAIINFVHVELPGVS